MKKRKVITLVLLVVVLFGVSAGLIGRFVYLEYILSRPADYTTFEPFSGKLFDIGPEKISHIDIRNNLDAPAGEYLHYEDTEDVKEIAAFLNSFRYRFWLPGPKNERDIPAGNRGVEVIKVYPAGIDPAYYKYKAMACMVHPERKAILVNSVWYFGDEEFFEKFNELK